MDCCPRTRSSRRTWRHRARAIVAGMLTERRTIRRATDLIAISPFVTQYYGTGIAGRVHEVPNAVAPSFFEVKRFPERGRYLFAGRIANGKGLIDLLHAIARNASTVKKVVLAGAAPDKSYENLVRMESERLGLSNIVVFAGLLDEASLQGEFSRAEALAIALSPGDGAHGRSASDGSRARCDRIESWRNPASDSA